MIERRIVLWVIVGILFFALLFLTFKAGAVGSSNTAIQATESVAKTAASSYGGMVGGC